MGHDTGGPVGRLGDVVAAGQAEWPDGMIVLRGGGRSGRVAAIASHPLPAGAELDVLPPFASG